MKLQQENQECIRSIVELLHHVKSHVMFTNFREK